MAVREPTTEKCPATQNEMTHHLVPRSVPGMRGTNVLTCQYCKKTEKELRDSDAG